MNDAKLMTINDVPLGQITYTLNLIPNDKTYSDVQAAEVRNPG